MDNKKTRRGVYINLDDSDIIAYGKYKFSSQKKREMFYKRENERMAYINKLIGKLYKYTGNNYTKSFNLYELVEKVRQKVYNEMEYK